jgi:hypothetical protein
MAQGTLRYDKMVENALRGVLREALTLTAKQGLPGAHHFYITFRTRHPGVVIPDPVRARYPEEMTIVLQHQFWGLDVTDSYFEVTLSFNRVNERLHVPFAAVSAFADPSAKFGLQFQVDESESDQRRPSTPPVESDVKEEAKPAEGTAQVIALDAFRKK